jgi:Haem-NO-binding
MHGIFFVLLQDYVHNPKLWKDVERGAVISSNLYFNNRNYPDDEFFRLAVQVAKIRSMELEIFFEDFGAFFCKFFFDTYSDALNPSWKLLDFIENGEYFFKKLLKLPDPQFQSAMFSCERKGSNEVHVFYNSPRKTCSILSGFIKAAAQHYGDNIDLIQQTCMRRGDHQCEFVVREQEGRPRR